MDNLQVKLQGEISLFIGGELVYKNHNAINISTYQEIIGRALANISPIVNAHIDECRAIGDFVTVTTPIKNCNWYNDTKEIEFEFEFEPGDFNGTVSQLQIGSSSLADNLYLANKEGLSILKDENNHLLILWKIKIN